MEQMTRILPPPFILGAAAVAVTFGMIAYRRSLTLPLGRRRLRAIGVGGLAGGGVFTLLITLINYTPTGVDQVGIETSLSLATRAQTAVNFALLWWIGVFLPLARPVRWAGSVIVVVIAALSIEFVQMMLPWRSADLMDVVLNVAGGALFAALGLGIARIAWGLDGRSNPRVTDD